MSLLARVYYYDATGYIVIYDDTPHSCAYCFLRLINSIINATNGSKREEGTLLLFHFLFSILLFSFFFPSSTFFPLYLFIFRTEPNVFKCGILLPRKNLPFFFFSSFCSEENSRNVRIVRGRFVRGRGNGFHYRWLVVICGSGSTERVGEFTLNARQGRGAGDTQRGRQRK